MIAVTMTEPGSLRRRFCGRNRDTTDYARTRYKIGGYDWIIFPDGAHVDSTDGLWSIERIAAAERTP